MSNTFTFIAHEPEKPNKYITFSTPYGEMLKLDANGDIYVKGKLISDEKEVCLAMREYLDHWWNNKTPVKTLEQAEHYANHVVVPTIEAELNTAKDQLKECVRLLNSVVKHTNDVQLEKNLEVYSLHEKIIETITPIAKSLKMVKE